MKTLLALIVVIIVSGCERPTKEPAPDRAHERSVRTTPIVDVDRGSAQSLAGTGGAGEVGNGGDSWALDFASIAHRVCDELARLPEADRLGVDPAAILAALDTARIESTTSAQAIEGAEKVAVNYPATRRIVIHRASWDALKNMVVRRRLVLHELLGLIGNDDLHYELSSRIYGNDRLGRNACDSLESEAELQSTAVALFRKRGHPVQDGVFSTGNDVDAAAGGFIRVLRGYEVTPSGSVNALLVIAECEPTSGRYRILSTSGSGAGLRTTCEQADPVYCPAP